MTAAYWLMGGGFVECEQEGRTRAEYGEQLLERLARDLNSRFGRGFSYPNLNRFRQFYLAFPPDEKLSAPSRESSLPILSTPSRESGQDRCRVLLEKVFPAFPPALVGPMSGACGEERTRPAILPDRALRGGWSVRQLDRQIIPVLCERTALSRNKAAMLTKDKGHCPRIASL